MAKFSVGEKESHDVEVRVHGYILHKVDIFVDGKPIGQWLRYLLRKLEERNTYDIVVFDSD
jgi:hypothetical protein